MIKRMQKNYDDIAPIEPTENKRSLADLYIRQRLNNGSDGFGMRNVYKIYLMLVANKQVLIDNGMISKDAVNNS